MSRTKNLARWGLIAGLLLVPSATLGILAAHAQPAQTAPSCEDRLAATAAYADLLKQVRDQVEQRMAELAAKVQALEKSAPKSAPAK